jgi:selenocysteine lyase/cysteine desulfurase
MPRSWETELRERFPATRSWTYLNSASAGPLTYNVARAGCSAYESMLGGGDADWPEMLAKAEEARALLAQLSGCVPEELAFTRNTSHSASLAAQMLWDEGHRQAVALQDEFPASTLPFLNRGFQLKFVSSVQGRYSYDAIEQALDGASVLISSHVMYKTGTVLDPVKLGDLAARRDAHFLLCVTQSLGALQVDFHRSRASFLLGTSHKWLCGGYGAGFLAMRRDLIGKLPWSGVGWLSQRDPERLRNDALDLLPEARVLEMGCANFPSLLALGAAVRGWLEVGPERVEQRVRALTLALRQKLNHAGFDVPIAPPEETSGITVVPFPYAEDASRALTDAHVAQTARGAGIRFAVHAFNDEADLDRAVRGMVELREKLPR